MKRLAFIHAAAAAAVAALVAAPAHAGLGGKLSAATIKQAVSTVKDSRTIIVQTSTMFDVRSIDQVVAQARAQAIRDIEAFDAATRKERQAPVRAAQAALDAATAERERAYRNLVEEYHPEYQQRQQELQRALAAEEQAVAARDEALRSVAMVETAAQQGRAMAIQNAESAARAAAERAARDQATERELQRLAQEAAIKNQAMLEQAFRDSLSRSGASVPSPVIDQYANSVAGTAFHCSAVARADDPPGETVLRCATTRAQAQ